MIDTLEVAKKLANVGFSTEQAETLAKIQSETLLGNVATRADLNELRIATKAEINEFRLEMRSEMAEFRLEMRSEMALLKSETSMLKWLGGIILAGVLALIIKTFF